MTFTQDTTLFGNPIQTSSVEVLSTSKTFGNQPNHHYIVVLKTGALPTLPTLLGNRSRYTFRNTTGSAINLAFTSGETIDGASSPIALAANSQATIVSEVSAAVGWTVLSFAPPTGAVVGTTDTQTLPNKTLTAPVINGAVTGTGVASASTASTLAARDAQANLSTDAVLLGFTTAAAAGGNTVLTVDSTELQECTGSSNQTYTLPTTSVLAGRKFTLLNSGTGTVTLNGSAGGGVASLAAGWQASVMAKIDTPTSGFSHWSLLNFLSTSSGFIDKTATANTLSQRTAQANIAADAFMPTLTSVATAAGTTVLTNDSTQDQRRTGSTTQTETLPTTSILAGMYYEYWNQSSGALTINASGGALVKTLAANSYTKVKAMIATPTVAADWFAT